MRKSNKIFVFINAILAVISVTVFCLLVYKIFSTQTDLILLNQSVADLRMKKEELGNISKNLGATLEDYELLRKLFVTTDGSVDFIEQIEAGAKLSALRSEVSSVSTEEREDLSPVGKELLVINLNTVGTFKDHMQFLELLQNLPYKVVLSELTVLKVKENQNKIGTLEVKAGEWQSAVKLKVIKQKKQ